MIRSRKGGIVLAIVAVTTALLLIACPEPSTGNSAPAFSSTTQTIRTDNTAAGSTVGTATAATDADSGDTLTYKLSGTDASNFAISSARVITVATGKTLVPGESYTVTVTANDGTADSSNTLTITITVTSGTGGANTAPTFGSTLTQDNLHRQYYGGRNSGNCECRDGCRQRRHIGLYVRRYRCQ